MAHSVQWMCKLMLVVLEQVQRAYNWPERRGLTPQKELVLARLAQVSQVYGWQMQRALMLQTALATVWQAGQPATMVVQLKRR
jgi:hypothetical protein